MSFLPLLLTALLMGAALSDLSTGRIYNLWILPSALTGILVRLMSLAPPWHGLRDLKIAAAAALLLVLLRVTRALGGGDIKLLGTLLLLTPPGLFFFGLLAGLFLSAVLGILTGRRHLPMGPFWALTYLTPILLMNGSPARSIGA